MDPRKLPLYQQIQDQFRIAAVRLLLRPSPFPDLGSMPNPNLMTQFLHRFKPGAVTAGLETDDYFATELSIELADFIDRLVPQLLFMDLSIITDTPLDQLLPA